MSQLYLPAEHTDADLVLAGTIAQQLASEELYVAWTQEHGHAAPEVAALVRDPVPHWADTLAFVFQAVRELWTAFLARDARAPRAGEPRATADPHAPQARPAAGEAAA
jgi:hypothetical protein